MDFDEKFFTEEIKGHIDYPHFLQRAKWIKSVIEKGVSVCILGCGFGHLVKHLIQLGVNAVGFDISRYAFEHRVSNLVMCGSAADVEIDSNTWVFSWNVLDCLDKITASEIAKNLSHINTQIHIVCCSGDYPGYFIKSKEYWEDLFPQAVIIDYQKPPSDLHVPTSWGRVSE